MVVDLALRPAVWWASYHVRQAGALAAATDIPWWQTVGSTGVGLTRVSLNGFWWGRWSSAGTERVSNIALVANADGEVVCHLAVCIGTT